MTMKHWLFYLLVLIPITFSCSSKETEEEKPIVIDVPEGFELEELYAPGENDRGSWVALARGPDSLMYACDQYGGIYYFPIPEVGEALDTNEIKRLRMPIGQAHSLLWAYNSLYVSVNGRMNENFLGSGVYRITDSDGDGELDRLRLLLELDGRGEHGPHALIPAGDGQSLYFLAGNHTKVPEQFTESRLPMNWEEDNLFPQYKDARGHASTIEAPGGWIAKTDSTGTNWEIISAGYRNPFDIDLNADGELFTFDADMEWDLGMPWYRPIRVCHVTSGSEYGWRTGSGKWPTYYPDNLPPVINLGQGSPTGIFMGKDLSFPAKYKNGLFVMDWSFGAIYFVDLQPEGATYTGAAEEFLTGTPLPLTDAIVGADGHLYFATGGRRLDSRLYRLRYTGSADTSTPAPDNKEARAARNLRHELEAFHNRQSPEAVGLAWRHLNHPDRFIRYAARIALEHQPVRRWASRVFREMDATTLIQATVALARTADSTFQTRVLRKLNTLDFPHLPKALQLDLLRAYSLLMIRMGAPEESVRRQTAEHLSPHYPANDYDLDRELSRLLLYLKAPEATAKTVALLEKVTEENVVTHPELLSEEATERSEQYGPAIQKMLENMPPQEAIYHAVSLSYVSSGWTDELRERYFRWFKGIFDSSGGMSFKGFIENVRATALQKIPEAERARYEEISGIFSPGDQLANLPQPEGPGRVYTNRELNRIVGEGLQNYEGDIAQGELIYKAALCESCHRMRGQGGNTGPDLTQIATRFNRGEIIYALVSPNDEISDQYVYTEFIMKNGSARAGRLLEERGDELIIGINPYDATATVSIPKDEVVEQKPSPISPMPPNLMNRLNEREIVDLMAYLMAGGDAEHEVYTGKTLE